MNVLEKITKEIEERVHMVENIPTHGEDDFLDGEECYEDGRVQGRYEELVWCRGMIHSNMDDAADMNNGWIPVEERLPEDERMVLVTCQTKKGIRSTNRAYYDGAFWHGSGSMSSVTAWCPLPEPYKPDEN